MDLPRPLARAWNDLPTTQRRAALALALLVAIVVAAFAALRLHDAIVRTREDVARDRLLLDVARARAAESVSLARASPPANSGNVRAAIDRVLAAAGLRYQALDARDDALQRILLEAAPFDALVRALDALMREDGVRVVDARVEARVDPGTVRAELSFTR